MASNLRQRAVVSSFICTSPQSPTGLTFALFKRSQDVSTYPGKWAVCSGSIDPTDTSPESAAKREISEETTLNDNDITLLHRGKPFSLIDEKLKTEWTIHPFAWELKPNAKSIKFDWEHTEYRFVKPEDLGKYDHVPQLEVGMKRVLVSEETEKGLRILKDDHESGAQALAVKALEILLDFVRGEEIAKISDPQESWNELRWRAWHLAKNGRPSMSAAIEAEVFKALGSAQQEIEEANHGGLIGCSLATLKSTLESAIEKRISARQHSLQSLADHFVEFIETDYSFKKDEDNSGSHHIVTLSSSGTTMQCLRSLIDHAAKNGSNVKLTVLESRPKFEGVSFVNTLLEPYLKDPKAISKLNIKIVSDASIASVLNGEGRNDDAYYLVLGADKVLQNGNVSNKIGSLAAAILAKTLNPECKVIGVFETSKITSQGFGSEHLEPEYNNAAELTNAWPHSEVEEIDKNRNRGVTIDVRNAYFEWVPAEYIDQYVTEQGVMGKNSIAKSAAESKKLEERVFGDL